MKIEVILSDNINEKCTGMTCYEAKEIIRKDIVNEKTIQGVIFINNIASKFSFSPMGMDGDIFTDNQTHREFIKYFIPIYVSTSKNQNK